MTKFWMVWNPQNRQPACKHETYDAAREESQRLAHKHPGGEFYVLEAVGMATTTNVEYRPIEAQAA